jgi:hypothetical protein
MSWRRRIPESPGYHRRYYDAMPSGDWYGAATRSRELGRINREMPYLPRSSQVSRPTSQGPLFPTTSIASQLRQRASRRMVLPRRTSSDSASRSSQIAASSSTSVQRDASQQSFSQLYSRRQSTSRHLSGHGSGSGSQAQVPSSADSSDSIVNLIPSVPAEHATRQRRQRGHGTSPTSQHATGVPQASQLGASRTASSLPFSRVRTTTESSLQRSFPSSGELNHAPRPKLRSRDLAPVHRRFLD